MTAKLWHHGIFVRAPLSAHENPMIIEFPAKFTPARAKIPLWLNL